MGQSKYSRSACSTAACKAQLYAKHNQQSITPLSLQVRETWLAVLLSLGHMVALQKCWPRPTIARRITDPHLSGNNYGLASCTSTHSLTLFSQENIFTIPNLLSVSRIALSPVLGYLVLVESYMLALGLFSLAGVSDLVSHLRQV